nr:hypothetical protein [Tessaracoccus coleopterorum]
MQLPLFQLEQWRDAIYSRIVDRVGTREYWDRWAADVATMSGAQIARIKTILANSSKDVTDTFDAFLAGYAPTSTTPSPATTPSPCCRST